MTLRAPFDAVDAGRGARVAILLAWLATVAFLLAHYAPWRDEVRGLTLALRGGDVVAMLRGVQGEGHPALWYLMLRGAHALLPVPQVLPTVAAAVGIAAAALFALRAPFRAWLIALVLFGGFALFEYVVIARNYGIAMLLLFALAAVKPGSGPVSRIAVGLLLALLANTNVPAALLVGAFLLFLAVEGDRRALFVAGGLAAVGVLVCFATVYPPVNDAAVAPHPGGITPTTILHALFALAPAFATLVPPVYADVPGIAGVLTVLLLAGPISLIRSPGGFVAALAALFGLAAFFGLIYPPSYRHTALYPVFLLVLHWMVANGRGGRWPERFAGRDARVAVAAGWGVVALLALQIPVSGAALLRAVRGIPYSHARDVAALLRTPSLRHAVVIASPDYLIEPLFYYVDNPAWLVREQRFAHIVSYSSTVRRVTDLDDVLGDARRVRRATGRPVVIALQTPPDPAAPPATMIDGYVTTFTTTPAQVRTFLAATRRIAVFRDAPGENYAVYVLRE